MSEAAGIVLLKVPDTLMKRLQNSRGFVKGDVILSLLAQAGVSPICSDDDEFSNERVSTKKGYVEIEVFGDEWMPLCRHIVENGSRIELYGTVSHEFGFSEYYALSSDGVSFFGTIDNESGCDVDDEELIQQWLAKVPSSVQTKFPELFSTDEVEFSSDAPSNFDQVVGVWNAKNFRKYENNDAYLVIRPDKTERLYFKEDGAESFQFYESRLEPRGDDLYMSVSKGGVTSLEIYCGSDAICLYKDKGSLVYGEMIPGCEDVQDSTVCPPASISENDIQPIVKIEYRQADKG